MRSRVLDNELSHPRDHEMVTRRGKSHDPSDFRSPAKLCCKVGHHICRRRFLVAVHPHEHSRLVLEELRPA